MSAKLQPQHDRDGASRSVADLTIARSALIGAIAAGTCAPPLSAASFDCSRASTAIETMICTDAELSALDTELGRIYAQSLEGAYPAGANDLRTEQRAWLRQRNDCNDGTCVAAAYRERIEALGGDLGYKDFGYVEWLGPVQVRESKDQVRIMQSGPKIDIEAVYPRLSGDGAVAANGLIAASATGQVADFRAEYERLLADGDRHIGPPWSLSLGYDEVYATPRFWSIDTSLYSYTGGAHGGIRHLPLVIDRAKGRLLEPSDLFRSGSDWPRTLSDYCYKSLADREVFSGDIDWLRRGTAPKAENYQALLPRADGLHVVFEQYQLGPYVIGFHEVTVPYAEISQTLNPALFGSDHQ
ncbi:MAG: DUF4163 domain-containing protein [Thiohalocapsa sp.]